MNFGEIITLRGAIALKLVDDRDGQYTVITDCPLSILAVPERIWGNESVRLSGAFVFPDSAASIATPHLYHGIEQVQNPKTETRPAEAHRCLYREVNYTEELKDEIARVRGVKPSQATQIQGFYDAKIITLRDTTLKTQIQQISLFKALQQFHLKSMRAL